MIFSEALSLANNSTRIALFASTIFGDCLRHCLNFNQIKFSFYSKKHQNVYPTDFQIFQIEVGEEFNAIKPNIAFIVPETDHQFAELNLEKIINGGVLIYNEKLEEKIAVTQGFFRKLSFENSQITTENSQIFLETDFSQIPLQISDPILIENLPGLKILCQQMGIMEEEFYEALMEFED